VLTAKPPSPTPTLLEVYGAPMAGSTAMHAGKCGSPGGGTGTGHA